MRSVCSLRGGELKHNSNLLNALFFWHILVNGGMEYPVLIKHGEDVRQDERIIQLLNAIDVALMRDIDSKERSLRIRTFQVQF